jgi:SAM-dependent methyltransferase
VTDAFWENAAQADPLWAILSDPMMRGRRWNLRDFFESGRREISLLDYQLRRLGRFPPGDRALDFGCGVGRLTQALGRTFPHVVGVDVSPTMVRLAERLNRHGDRVRYVVIDEPRLEGIPSDAFALVYSDIVLQHVEPERAVGYISEFLRVLAPGGVTVFQVPSHRRHAGETVAAPVSMPLDAYRADVRIVKGPPPEMKPGQRTSVILEITNASRLSWDQRSAGAIRIGNHWRSAAGDLLVQDDGRSVVPEVMMPGDVARTVVTVEAPPGSSTLRCEFDVVHEGISWFADRGSRVASVAVTIGAPAHSAEAAPGASLERAGDRPVECPDIYAELPAISAVTLQDFPMHGVPRDEVLELIARHGCETFFIEDDERGGPEWRGYRYYVAKP